MTTRREFLKLTGGGIIAGLCAFFRPPANAQAQPQAQPEAQAWGFPLPWPAYFLEGSPLRRPNRDYYRTVIRNNG